MARIYNKPQYNNQFQPQAQSQRIDPVVAVDRRREIEKEQARIQKDIETKAKSEQRQASLDSGVLKARQVMESANMRSQQAMVNGIIKLSGTALKGWELAEKHKQEQAEIKELMDYIFGSGTPGDDGISNPENQTVVEQTEQAEQQEADQQTIDGATETAVQEVTDDPVAQEEARKETADGAAERARSRTDARTLAANLPALVIAELESGPPPTSAAEVAERTRQIIAEMTKGAGVMGMSITQLRTLANSITNTISQVNSTYLPQIIAGQQEERKQAHIDEWNSTWELEQQNGQGTQNIQQGYQQLADSLWSTGIYKTRGEANKAALQHMMTYLTNSKDIEALEAMKDILTNGKEGTEAWKTYGQDIDKAIQQVKSGQKVEEQEQREELESTMYEQLSEANTPAEREAIIQETIKSLRERGMHEEAYELEQEMEQLRQPGQVGVNGERAREDILNGNITDQKTLDEMLRKGVISASDYESLTQLLQGRNNTNPSSDPRIKNIQETTQERIVEIVSVALGLSKDPSTGLISGTGDNPYLDAGDWAVIKGQLETDAITFINTLISTKPELANDPAAIQAEVNKWVQEVTGPGGKYDLTGMDKLEDPAFRESEEGKKIQNRFRNLVDDPKRLQMLQGSTFAGPEGSRVAEPITWTGFQLEEDGTPHAYVIEHFNGLRGDKLFNEKDLAEIGSAFERGEMDPRLVAAAEALNMSPSQLINQQAAAWGLDPFVYRGERPQVSPAQGGSADPNSAPTAVQGARMLMGMGLPARGAAWLSGNIQQESSWEGQRSWGQVMNDGTSRNGGLVSWASWANDPARLGLIEAHLGKPIEQASDAEQLDAMMWEMQKNYPEAYKIFMNPYASERDLMRASYQYWGFGHEGGRYAYARDIERQLG